MLAAPDAAQLPVQVLDGCLRVAIVVFIRVFLLLNLRLGHEGVIGTIGQRE